MARPHKAENNLMPSAIGCQAKDLVATYAEFRRRARTYWRFRLQTQHQ